MTLEIKDDLLVCLLVCLVMSPGELRQGPYKIPSYLLEGDAGYGDEWYRSCLPGMTLGAALLDVWYLQDHPGPVERIMQLFQGVLRF